MYTAIIVEDMPSALELMKRDIDSEFPEIQIIGTAESVVQAAKLLKLQIPDILFLDISLTDGTAFDLLDIFPDLKCKIVFTTAYDEFALKAFRYSAIDYLLKPIEINALRSTIEKIKKYSISENLNLGLLRETFQNSNTLPGKLSLHTLDKIYLVTVKDIIRCESDGNNTLFYLNNGEKIYVTKTLKYFEEILLDHNFIRVHQSHLVNFHSIKEFIKQDGGYLKLINGDKIPVSSRKKTEVLERIEQLK